MIALTERTFPQPTLSLYLGGSGILVGDRLLTLLEGLDANERSMFEAFFIDSQAPAIVDHARSRHYCYQNLNQFRDPTYKDFTANRFPENLGITPVVNSCEGCGVTRVFGAASLVNCRDNFASLLEQTSGRLRRNRRESTQPMQVFLTASACGGTGAGMILDAAALIRHYFRERGETPRIFLFLIGPTVFLEDPSISLREDQRARMRASSYALLKELNHFAQGNPFVSAYRLRDQTVRIGNTSDDDRLFEWIYWIDGRGEQTSSTRTLAEVAWMIAEAQVHLAVTEVGRKVAESMPNQREERVREYALDFIHTDHKGRMSKDGRKQLQIASRRTFLASFSVRNVRFPADEVKAWFRWGWVREALHKAMRRGSDRGKSQVEQFDALLGYDGEQVQPEGLLSDLGLTREQLTLRVKEEAVQDQALLKTLSVGLDPTAAVSATEEFLGVATSLIEDIKKDSSLVELETTVAKGQAKSCAQVVMQAFPRWKNFWIDGLGRNGKIAERLWEVACARATGRGLRFLDAFLAYASGVLTNLASEGKRRPNVDELEASVADVQRNARALDKAIGRERGKGISWRRAMILVHLAPQYSDELQRRAKGLVTQANALRQKILHERSMRVADLLAPAAWLQSAEFLKEWRDHVLTPTITASANALTLADNQWKLSREALKKHQGMSSRGRWIAHSTLQVADDDLLHALAASIGDRVSVDDLVLGPLQGEGISRDRHRLTMRSLPTFDRKTVVDILFAHIDDATRGTLTFLDNGWMLEDVSKELGSAAARALDLGAEPLARFSRVAIGQPLQSYLLAPDDLLLPEPFGQELGRMYRLVSRDPLQLGVVSFVFGIPPNSLDGIRELFHQYAVHVGDPLRYEKQSDRFPLHIFREATESFHEPYSPLAFSMNDAFVQSLIDAAHELWPGNGSRVELDIREFDASSPEHRADWDRIIELAEKVLHQLILSPDEADRLFRDPRFMDLERLYRIRKYDLRDPASSTETAGARGNGNGNGNGNRTGTQPPAEMANDPDQRSSEKV